MIKIEIIRTKAGSYKGFSCSGHAGYANTGQDIICAAISALTVNTINSLEELVHEKMEVQSDERAGMIRCRFTEPISDQGRLLVDSYILGCDNIQQSYGKKYVKVYKKEV